ncbi:MAG: hypothetical protein K0R26_994 [Bacteroidota bacterium]|jgi:hypothetical protein|nr:hypothetical protein [Bacteroidota bacterium]
MKSLILTLSIFALTLTNFAQEKSEAIKLVENSLAVKDITVDSAKFWKIGGVVSLNGQQVSLTNWSAGGNNSVSLAGLVNVFAKYKKGKINWETNLDLGYGVINQGDAKKWWKNDDKIQFSTKFGRELKKHWYLAMLADFRTQFTNGYNYPNDSVYISKFMAPAYGLAAIGFDYKPNDNFSLLLSPVTGKFTYVIDDSLAKYGAFGVQKEIRDPNDGRITQRYLTHREEFGAYLKMQYQTKVMENVTFQTVLELFSNYFYNPENIDVNWSTLTTLKVNKYISATLTTQLIYDDDIKVLRTSGDQKGTVGPDVQFKQVLGVGFSYKF